MTRGGVAFAVLAVAAAALGLTAAGDTTSRTGRLVWAGAARTVAPGVLHGTVRNDGQRPLRLAAAEARVLDARGRALPSTVRFLDAYAPGRNGRAVTLAPGETAPLTVAWRGGGARRISVGAATLSLTGVAP
jgi:hypothetical protein